MKRRLFLSLLAISCLTIGLVYSEIIKFKNGKRIEAPIIEKTSEYIRIDFQGVPIKYYSDEIESIYKEQLSQPWVEPRKRSEYEGYYSSTTKKVTVENESQADQSKSSSGKSQELAPEIIELQKKIADLYQKDIVNLYKNMGNPADFQKALKQLENSIPGRESSPLSSDPEKAEEYMEMLRKMLPEAQKYKDLDKEQK